MAKPKLTKKLCELATELGYLLSTLALDPTAIMANDDPPSVDDPLQTRQGSDYSQCSHSEVCLDGRVPECGHLLALFRKEKELSAALEDKALPVV